jgi:hypothetical protein
VRQVPDSIDLRALFDAHKFGGARVRPVRMDPRMTAMVVPVKGGIGLDMVWTLLIEEKADDAKSYKPVCTLVADDDEGLPKLLRDVAELIERGETKVARDKPNYRKLLAELYAMPAYPTPVDGEMSTPDIWQEQERWRERYDALSKRIDAALNLE